MRSSIGNWALWGPLAGIFAVVGACLSHESAETAAPEPVELPLTTRSFLTGTTPSVNRTKNPAAAFILSKEVGRLTMFWVTPNGIGLFQQVSKQNPAAKKTNYEAIQDIGLIPVIHLNPWTVQPGKGVVRNDGSGSSDFSNPDFVARMCEEAGKIAERFRPRYFSIGNEINSVHEWLGPKTFEDLAALEKKLYETIKRASAETKVLVVFSYSQLVDLPGAPRFHLVEKLDGSYDVLGLTTYPWKNYEIPEELPDDYYSRIMKYTAKPIGFTEIAWSSDKAQGGSEQEQVEFLLRFLKLTRDIPLEFVSWAFLHDLPQESVTGFIIQKTHVGLGLRKYDGSPKRVWSYFRALSLLPGP